MTPVISPWVFYALSVTTAIKVIGTIAATLFTIVAGIFIVIKYTEEFDYGTDSEDYKTASKILKKVIPATILCILIAIFTPSSNTITKMIVAQNVTYERVEMAADTVQTIYEDIMHLFEKE